jgi:hypothetical protein
LNVPAVSNTTCDEVWFGGKGLGGAPHVIGCPPAGLKVGWCCCDVLLTQNTVSLVLMAVAGKTAVPPAPLEIAIFTIFDSGICVLPFLQAAQIHLHLHARDKSNQ